MIAPLSALLLGAAAIVSGLPVNEKRVVTSLNEAAFAEAQQRDDTATRAFSSIPIKTSDGKCLFVDELSGDFRANLTPIQVVDCDGSAGQTWDIITSGKHDNIPGTILVVSALTQACLNFDPRRAAGNQVLLFSCGGRADGSGQVQSAQIFPFTGGEGPLSLTPTSASGTCITVNGNLLDQAACNAADPNQSFTFGDAAAATPPADDSTTDDSTDDDGDDSSECSADPPQDPIGDASTTSEETVSSTTATAVADTSVTTTTVDPPSTTLVVSTTTTTTAASTTTTAAALSTTTTTTTSSSASTTTAAPVGAVPDFNPTSAVPVSRAGGVLQPSSAAEANQRDDTATRAFSSVSLKSADGKCLFIDPTAGDFRENLIPIQLQDCTGGPNELFDIITAGKHNNEPGNALIVSTLTQGCVNFDPRRAAGDTVIMFSCGGRADGDSTTTDSQLFPFTAGETSLALAPKNANGATCLAPNGALLDSTACTNAASQLFTIG